MRFTEDKTDAINDRLEDMKKETPPTYGRQLGVDVTLGNALAYGAAAYNRELFICTVEELDRTIEELKMLKKSIEEETGIKF